MVISWFLIVIFLIAILLEIGFLGRYVSISQNIFHNRTFASFGLGATIYFGLTLLVLFPFLWLDLTLIWYAVIIFTKDFFTFVFLISRRDKFEKWKLNVNEVFIMILTGIALPFFYRFGMSEWFTLKEIPLKSNNIKGSNIFQTYPIWIDAMTEITRASKENIRNFVVNPIVSVTFIAAIGGLYTEFTKSKNWFDILGIFALTILIILLFNMKIELSYQIYIPFIIMMIHYGYNIIMFSRRRYGSLFGVLTLVVWTINPLTFWLIFLVGVSVSLLYVILHKRRPSVFILQIVSPMLILIALRFVDYSSILAFVLSSLAIAMYLSIFFFGRTEFIERTNVIFGFVGYIWLIIAFMVIALTGLSLGFIDNNFRDVFQEGNELFTNYDSDVFDIMQNFVYYFLASFLIWYGFSCYLEKTKPIKIRIILFLGVIMILTMFNPLSQLIFDYAGSSEQYAYFKLGLMPMLLIISGAKISNMLKKKNKGP